MRERVKVIGGVSGFTMAFAMCGLAICSIWQMAAPGILWKYGIASFGSLTVIAGAVFALCCVADE